MASVREKPIEQQVQPATRPLQELDALIIGAGVTGLYQLHCLRQLGMNARIFEAGGGVGGTWYWNRYPGARFDSESYSYAYGFSEELLQEWDWTEHFSGQPENEKYLNFMADKFALKPHIQFNARIKSAHYDKASNRWNVTTEEGHRASAQFLISAVGILSATHMPDIPGAASFKGESFHTSRWPHEKVDFTGKRVGVIGTGATAVQLIPMIAKEVGHLTVFQRTPNYCSPLRNATIDPETQKKIKASYPEIFAKCRATFASFMQDFDPRKTFDVPEAERHAFYEEIWSQPGFTKWFGCFHDIMTDEAANEDYAEFVRNKIRARVKDPVVAEKLVPKDHPFGSKRIPLETGYYEAYNQDNVLLVDVSGCPIESITEKGVKTGDAEYELDVIIYATGFDAITGELTRMDLRGENGVSIKEKWADGASTYLTLQTAGFPNLFIANGAVFCNFTRCAEVVAEWVRNCLGYMREKGYTRIEADPKAEEAWTEHANSLTEGMLFTKTKSWFMGTNVAGKKKAFLFYAGGAPAFRDKTAEVAAKGYEGFILN
ncbi:MAG: NAD(P)/FAD-dependent oxidoreductase [Gammaproteobacteria bacterium]|nr:NAD(P)/FAD-dependent oxidoreductase [Gammaproteobacteria bacterium]